MVFIWLCGYNIVCVCVSTHSYFIDNQYPDESKREEIATACNAVIQKPGRSIHSGLTWAQMINSVHFDFLFKKIVLVFAFWQRS